MPRDRMRHPLFAADPQGYQEYTSIVSGWSSATIASSGNAHAKLHYGNDDDRNLQFTTILGFLGMMRPHSLQGLRPESFHIVTSNGTVNPMSNQRDIFHEELVNLLRKEKIVGYYVEFRSKTMAKARAHFPLLSTNVLLSAICPVRALIDVSQRGLIKKGFLYTINKQQRLTKYLQSLTGLEQHIAPYAMRIGGRTWFLAQGMDRQLVDFLGTWKSPEASARYFRAAPQSVFRLLIRFFIETLGSARREDII